MSFWEGIHGAPDSLLAVLEHWKNEVDKKKDFGHFSLNSRKPLTVYAIK